MVSISIAPPDREDPPPLDGFTLSDTAWVVDPEPYQAFIEAVTGETVPEEPTPADCYRIGNRLEGFISERIQAEDWQDSLLEEYPDISSREEALWLARFFRYCHQCRIPSE